MGHAAGATHVHVCVKNLSTVQILSVFFGWVKFQLVTKHFIAPWMWRDRSSAVLFASGPESEWVESPWQLRGFHAALEHANAGFSNVRKYWYAVLEEML